MNEMQIRMFKSSHKEYERIVKRISRAAQYNTTAWEADQILGRELNAAITTEGKVVVTRKALKALEFDELAFLVAHEVAHWEDLNDEGKDQEAFFDKVERISNSRNSFFVGLIGAYFEIKSEARILESESDLHAIELMHMADFNIEAAITAMEKMKQLNDTAKGFIDIFTVSHPPFDLRIAAIREKIDEIQEEFDDDDEDGEGGEGNNED